jgi:hypothetical protein
MIAPWKNKKVAHAEVEHEGTWYVISTGLFLRGEDEPFAETLVCTGEEWHGGSGASDGLGYVRADASSAVKQHAEVMLFVAKHGGEEWAKSLAK